MPDADIDVSFVVPVYNKSAVLPYFLASLAAQEGDFKTEYIFVDDVSTDDTLDVLQSELAGWPNVTILENAANAGPAIRINQGAAQARGRFLCLFDPDEVIATDAVKTMLDLLERHQADILHGKWQKTDEPASHIVAGRIGPEPRHTVSDQPLDTVLGRGFVRMAWLVRRSLFERAGGCDERIFIQDEALPLRLGLHAERLVDLREIVTYVPTGGDHLSQNKAQQHHDRFFANRLFAQDTPALSDTQRRAVYRKCLSSAWKSAREGGFSALKLRILARYLASRLGRDRPDDAALRGMADYFTGLAGVRRPGHGPDKD